MRYYYLLLRSISIHIIKFRMILLAFCLLVFFDLSLISQNVTPDYAPVSQLASGNWLKIAVNKPGIHKLTYSDLSNTQLLADNRSSVNIRLHGYSGMINERAGAFRYDDLPEVAIMMFDGNDGSFDQGDFILFYTPGPNAWNYSQQYDVFGYSVNIYSDFSYYFLTIGDRPGLRIAGAQQPQTASQEIQFYKYREAISPELENLIKSGRGWYGDFFDIITEREYSFEPISTKPQSELKLRFSAVARSFWGSSFTLSVDAVEHDLPISPVPDDYNANYGQIATSRFSQPAPSLFNKAKVTFTKSTNLDLGWLNFIEVNADALLKYNNRQLLFRNTGIIADVEYVIDNANPSMVLWDVTDQILPLKMTSTVINSKLRFKATLDTIREYVLADPSQYMSPVSIEKIPNQNLHALPTPKMLIIAHPDFMNEAVRLATYHANKDDFSVSVVTPQSIYNEFSSGAQDISAIRDFIRMLWHRTEGENLPRYILLFGDASYDYKDRIDSNSNFIPTYQSPESLSPVSSIATDDFFVCIDDNEGGLPEDMVDIGIGRLPVRTPEEAKLAVDKIIHYVEDTENVNGEWRNVIAFVADDEDGNVHMDQADQIAVMIDTTFRNYNADRIFLDAYLQESTAGGQRSPDANQAINARVGKGALIINYTGHGGETGWTKEQILEVKDIVGWKNYNTLPVFMTATCEFSRYDDPLRVSGGEYAFLNPTGGAIALFTTARPTYGQPNFLLAKIFYNTALKPLNGSMPRLGDIIRISKTMAGSSDNINNKKFVLLGDPAMTMAYPKYNIITTEINGISTDSEADTLNALQSVVIKGIISDQSGNKLSSFNGTVIPTVFDKKSEVVTYGTDGAGPMSFNLWQNIIYKGRAEVKNGEFSFSFIVPKDIAYNFGFGKISYYATDGTNDAAGNHSKLVIGGFTDGQIDDDLGPVASLFINDSSFKDGGFTDENPVLLAYINDSSGINTLGNSIGHDLVAILDNDTQNPYILNDYYRADLNTFKSGSLFFPMQNLEPGPHTIRLRIWDVNNNSSETEIRFIVAAGNEIVLSELEVWPNPVNRLHDEMTFIVGHNQANKQLKAELSVYSIAGKRVCVLNKDILAEGYRTQLFKWNGIGNEGHAISPGFYIGNIRITTPEGYSADKSVKFIIAR